MTAMKLRRIPWKGEEDPGEYALRSRLEAEGFEVHTWSDPADRIYGEHHHECDETLWMVRGSMLFSVKGRDYRLGPGDRLQLPANIAHRAVAGPAGATYLIGQRRESADAQRAAGERSPSG